MPSFHTRSPKPQIITIQIEHVSLYWSASCSSVVWGWTWSGDNRLLNHEDYVPVFSPTKTLKLSVPWYVLRSVLGFVRRSNLRYVRSIYTISHTFCLTICSMICPIVHPTICPTICSTMCPTICPMICHTIYPTIYPTICHTISLYHIT